LCVESFPKVLAGITRSSGSN